MLLLMQRGPRLLLLLQQLLGCEGLWQCRLLLLLLLLLLWQLGCDSLRRWWRGRRHGCH